MYKYSVPIMFHSVNSENRQAIASNLKKCGVERIFFALDHYLFAENGDYNTEHQQNTIKYFQSSGFEVGVWCNSFGHGGMLSHERDGEKEKIPYTLLEGINGKNEYSVCPADERVLEIFTKRIKLVAEMNPDLIMLDDDYRLNYRNYTMGCVCPLHLEEYYKRIGEVIPKEELEKKIFSGGKNRYRDEWLNLMRDTLVDFAKKMREAVDSVNSNIRLSACACWDVWDFEGTNCLELAKTFAGKTKPYLRTIGAPYHHQKVSMAVESTRAQAFWCKGSNTEIFSEGDVYPRPRYNVPARQLELFDLALMASGETDGILKYMYDYVQPFGYETGYTDRHIRNAEIRKALSEITEGKKAVGVRVIDIMEKVRNWHLPDEAPDGVASYLVCAVSRTQQAKCLLTDNAIPITYDDKTAPLFIVGEDAWYVDEAELDNGAILDIDAADILSGRGIDVGLLGLREAPQYGEKYLSINDTISDIHDVQTFEIECNGKASAETVFVPSDSPASYHYENQKGQRFFVLASAFLRRDFKGKGVAVNYTSNYYRKAQLVSAIEYVSRKSLPVKTISRSPDLYVIATESEDKASLAVSVSNPFADDAFDVEFTLSKKYESIRFINCTGKFNGESVKIDYIEPYGFISFEVK